MESNALDPATEERLLSRWVVSGLFGARWSAGASVSRRAFALMPAKTAANRDRAARWAMRKMGELPEVDDVLHAFLEWSVRPLVAGRAVQIWRDTEDALARSWMMVYMRCAALHCDKAQEFEAALSEVGAEERERYAKERDEALRSAREWEEGERRRRADARAQTSGLQAAREEAARQAKRAEHAARVAADRVAAVERQRRAQEAELARALEEIGLLRDLLAERDAEIAQIVQLYEQRLSELRRGGELCEPRPLEGLSVIVVADPNRAAAYRSEAMSLGAVHVEFIDGMLHPGAHLRNLVEGADCVVMCLAWTKHSTSSIVRRRARGRICEMTVAGLRAFREAVVAGDPQDRPPVPTAVGAMPAHTRTLRVVGSAARSR